MECRKYLIIFLILVSNTVIAQSISKNALYLSQELNFGNYLGFNLGLNYDLNLRIPRSRPKDYSPDLFNSLIQGVKFPYEQMQTWQLTVGNIYNLRNDGSIRLKLSFGVGYTTFSEPKEWQESQDDHTGGNYTWENKNRYTTSLIINPKLEIPMTSNYGVSISPVLHLNREIFYYGISLGQLLLMD